MAGDAVACTQYWDTIPGASPSSWSDRERFERSAQDAIRPYIHGVAYDNRHERVFLSACPEREFECDLLTIDLSNADPSRTLNAAYFRSSRAFGYTWPSVSPDGRFLAAVRTPRRERATQRVLHQELVEIDLDTDSERLLAEAGPDGRFERVVHGGQSTVMVARSYRSTPDVSCEGWFCTDEMQLVIVRSGASTVAPLRTTARGASMDIVPVGGGRYLVSAAVPHGWSVEYRAAIIDPASANWLWPFARSIDALSDLGESTGAWSADQLRSRWVPPAHLPFCGTRGEASYRYQAQVFDGSRAIFVMKRARRASSSADTLEVVLLENRQAVPWETTRHVVARYERRN